MKKFLKFTVVSLGILIIILLSITIIVIFKKYKNDDKILSNSLILNPLIEDVYEFKDFQIEKSKIHIYLENINGNSQVIRTYDTKSGKKISEIKIK
jgi:hypothetical protein